MNIDQLYLYVLVVPLLIGGIAFIAKTFFWPSIIAGLTETVSKNLGASLTELSATVNDQGDRITAQGQRITQAEARYDGQLDDIRRRLP